MSFFRFQISDFRFQISDFRVSDTVHIHTYTDGEAHRQQERPVSVFPRPSHSILRGHLRGHLSYVLAESILTSVPPAVDTDTSIRAGHEHIRAGHAPPRAYARDTRGHERTPRDTRGTRAYAA